MQLLPSTPEWPQIFGRGMKLSIACPIFAAPGFNATRPAILFPGTGFPVVGSVRLNGTPLASVYPEKSPARWATVGMLAYPESVAGFCLVYSCDQKKNSFDFCVLNSFGMYTGPPIEYPHTKKR